MARQPGEVYVPITTDIGPLDQQLRQGVQKLEGFSTQAARAGRGLDQFEQSAKRATGSNAAFFRGLSFGTRGIEKTSDSLMGMGRSFGSASDKARRAESSFRDMGSSAGDLAARYLSLAAAVGVATSAIGKFNEQRETSKASVRGLFDVRRDLSTMADTDEQREKLFKFADDLATRNRFGMTRAQAGRLVFAGKSDELTDAQIATTAAAATVFGAETAATVAGKVPSLFAGALTPKQALSATFIGARAANINPQEFGRFLPMAAEATKVSGATPEEVIAGLSATSRRFGSPSAAAERQRAFMFAISRDKGMSDAEFKAKMAEIDQKLIQADQHSTEAARLIKEKEELRAEKARGGLAGRGMEFALNQLTQMSEGEREKILKDMGAISYFSALQDNADRFRRNMRLQLADRPTGGAALDRGIAIRQGGASFQAVSEEIRAQAALDRATEGAAIGGIRRGAGRQVRYEQAGMAMRALMNIGDAMGLPGTDFDVLKLSEMAVRGMAGSLYGENVQLPPKINLAPGSEIGATMEKAANAMNRAAEALDNAAQPPVAETLP